MARRSVEPPEDGAEPENAIEEPKRPRPRVVETPPEEEYEAPPIEVAPPAPEDEDRSPHPVSSPASERAPVAASDSSQQSMLRDKRIGIIGAGAMGSALCRGLIHAGAAPANRIIVSDLHPAHVQTLQQSLGVKVAQDNNQVAKYTDIIVLAVKPYTVPDVLAEIAESLKRDEGKPQPLLLSIAAGVRIETLESLLKAPIPVVRAMPNTPAQVGLGACAYCRGTHADDDHTRQAAAIFQSVGIALEVPESMMDAVTALSGSGPAYVYLMIEALVDGGVKVGLPRDVAHQLAAQTVLGAAQMVLETKLHPAQLRDMVTTPAGTTIAAIAALEHSGVRAALIDAVERATERARELA
jgi:pyrroline-5-carboxylate reductase